MIHAQELSFRSLSNKMIYNCIKILYIRQKGTLEHVIVLVLSSFTDLSYSSFCPDFDKTVHYKFIKIVLFSCSISERNCLII